MKRRSFLASVLAAGVAPAAVGSGILMPVRPPIWTPPDVEISDAMHELMVLGSCVLLDGKFIPARSYNVHQVSQNGVGDWTITFTHPIGGRS